MNIGVQYYRDPNPPEPCWEQDLADIAAAGFKVIGCWIPWRYVNPEEGRWELDKYRRLLDLAHRNDLLVRVQLVPESAPDWAVWKHPDALMVSDAGQPVYLHPHPMLQLGGWPGLSPFHPAARLLVNDYYRQIVTRLKDHPAVAVWSIWNEIQAETTYDACAQAAYRDWLRDRYGTIDAYNRARSAGCRDFDDAMMPNPKIEGSMVLSRAGDLAEFRREWCIAEAARRAGWVRECDGTRPVAAHTNSPSPYSHRKDDWGVAGHVDLYGDSHYHAHPFYDVMSFVRCRSVSGPGRWWMTEHCSGRMVYHYGHQTLSGKQLCSNALLALAHGASTAAFWQYRAEWAEQEAPNFNLLHQDGTPSERLAALSHLAGKVRDVDVSHLSYDPAEVGVLVEPMDSVFRTAADAWRKQTWQEAIEMERWLWALLNGGYTADFLLARRLPDAGIPSAMKVILAPSLSVLRPGVAEALADWVRNGGCLVAGPFTGVYDLDGRVFGETPGGGLSEVFGLTVTDRVGGETFELLDRAGGAAVLRGRHLFEQVRLKDGADPSLAWGEFPGLVANSYGKGTAFYAATFLGADDETFVQDDVGERGLLARWLDETLRAMGIRPPVETDGVLWQTAARAGDARLVFLFNPRTRPVTLDVTLPDEGTAWHDRITGEAIEVDGPRASLVFDPRQTRVLSCAKR